MMALCPPTEKSLQTLYSECEVNIMKIRFRKQKAWTPAREKFRVGFWFGRTLFSVTIDVR